MSVRFGRLALVVAGFAVVLTGVFLFSGSGSGVLAADPPQAGPERRVIACYFHRTQRCPTCLKIGSYVEEAIKTGFWEEIAKGRVVLTMVDFQDPRNERLAAYYRITGPTLVVIDAVGDRAAHWKPAPKVWSLVGKKAELVKYVQDEVRSYLEKQE